MRRCICKLLAYKDKAKQGKPRQAKIKKKKNERGFLGHVITHLNEQPALNCLCVWAIEHATQLMSLDLLYPHYTEN